MLSEKKELIDNLDYEKLLFICHAVPEGSKFWDSETRYYVRDRMARISNKYFRIELNNIRDKIKLIVGYDFDNMDIEI